MSGRHSAQIASHVHLRARSSPPRGRRIALVVASTVLIAAASAIVVVLRTGGSSRTPAAVASSSAGCQNGVPLSVIAAPEVQAATQQIADEWSATRPTVNGTCITVSVDQEDPSAVVQSLRVSPANTLWISDSRFWADQLHAANASVKAAITVNGSVGSSPLVVATAPSRVKSVATAAKSGWSAVLTGTTAVAMPDPLNTSEGALSALALQSSMGSAPNGSAVVVGAFVRLATTAIENTDEGFQALQSSPASAPPFVASEQEVVLANREKKAPMVAAVYPKGPTPVLDFPVVRVSVPNADPKVVAAQALFVSELNSAAAHVAYAQAGLRADPSLPLGAGENNIGVSQLPVTASSSPAATQVALTSRLWVAAVKPSNLLTAIDVSGSMAETSGTALSKIALASQAAQTAMAIVPDSWTMGIWSFSTADPPATDWTELVPLSTVGSSRSALNSAAASLPAHVGGNTGLYDTAWAAFQDVTRNYNPADVNIVAVLTDGANVDPVGIDLRTLTSRLKASYNPARPVRIVTIGMGTQADAAALQAISNATHGQTYIVRNPVDIKNVLLQAIIANN
jgi:Ca-activated chloride channel homolog